MNKWQINDSHVLNGKCIENCVSYMRGINKNSDLSQQSFIVAG